MSEADAEELGAALIAAAARADREGAEVLFDRAFSDWERVHGAAWFLAWVAASRIEGAGEDPGELAREFIADRMAWDACVRRDDDDGDGAVSDDRPGG